MKKVCAFDLMKNNYDVNKEIIKLNELLFKTPMFVDMTFFQVTKSYTFADIFDSFIIRKWKFRRSYICLQNILDDNNLNLKDKYTNEQLINFLEIALNVYNEFSDFNINVIKQVQPIKDNIRFLEDTINLLLDNLALKKQKRSDGWIELIPENEAMDTIIEGLNGSVQWEIVSYQKIKKDDLDAKRKQLAYLATELNIEQDAKENNPLLRNVMNDCTLILNNLNIRHNNTTGKWEKSAIKTMKKREAIEFCDILYDKILIVQLIRKASKTQGKIDGLRKKLKE